MKKQERKSTRSKRIFRSITKNLLKRLTTPQVFEKHILPNLDAICEISWLWEEALLPLGTALSEAFGTTDISHDQLKVLTHGSSMEAGTREKALLQSEALFDSAITPSQLHMATLASPLVNTLLQKGRVIKCAGIAGPGAVGKTTTINNLLPLDGSKKYEKIIKMTSRPPREGEKDGVDYFFVHETKILSLPKEDIVTLNFRPKKGHYALTKAILANILARAQEKNKTCLLEGKAENVVKAFDYLRDSGLNGDSILIYILPPLPLLPHLAARLASRCEADGSNFAEVMEPTLGQRQIDELNSLIPYLNKVPILIVVNEKIEDTVSYIDSILQ